VHIPCIRQPDSKIVKFEVKSAQSEVLQRTLEEEMHESMQSLGLCDIPLPRRVQASIDTTTTDTAQITPTNVNVGLGNHSKVSNLSKKSIELNGTVPISAIISPNRILSESKIDLSTKTEKTKTSTVREAVSFQPAALGAARISDMNHTSFRGEERKESEEQFEYEAFANGDESKDIDMNNFMTASEGLGAHIDSRISRPYQVTF